LTRTPRDRAPMRTFKSSSVKLNWRVCSSGFLKLTNEQPFRKELTECSTEIFYSICFLADVTDVFSASRYGHAKFAAACPPCSHTQIKMAADKQNTDVRFMAILSL
jgi:hypothetical protein